MIHLHATESSAWALTDDELLASVQWRKVRGSDAAEAASKGVTHFSTWLARPTSLPAWKTTGAVPDPLWQVLWSRTAFGSTGRSDTVAGVIERFATDSAKRTRAKMVAMLLNEFDSERPANPFELLALLALLRTRRTELTAASRWQLFRLVLLSANGLAAESEHAAPGREDADQYLVRCGELPLQIGRLFDAVHGSPHLRKCGLATLSLMLDEETDTDGTPHGRILDRLPLFIASLTRSVSSQAKSQKATFAGADQSRFAGLVRESSLLADQSGRPAFSRGRTFAPASLLHAAVSIAKLPPRDPARRSLASTPSEFQAEPKKQPSTKTPKFSVASGQSEWGGVATFRGDFASPKVVMTIDYHDACPRVSVQLDGQTVISGPWEVETTIGGRPVEEPDGWSSVCWFSDDEADYLELQADLSEDIQLTRHLIYAHDDSVLILAAGLRNAGPGAVESIVRLPFGEGVQAMLDKDSRLVNLKKRSPLRLVPLGLEADPFLSSSGSLAISEDAIRVTQTNPSDGICVPIAFDLKPKGKGRKSIEWRRLTVAEGGRAISKGHGDAWRLRLGDFDDSPQWVYYQGLSEAAVSRTILGMHTPYEMVFGRFEDGEVDPLVHVESE